MPPLTCARIVVGTTLSWSASRRIVNPSGPAASHNLTAASTIFARVIPALWPALRLVAFLMTFSATPPPMTKAARLGQAREKLFTGSFNCQLQHLTRRPARLASPQALREGTAG